MASLPTARYFAGLSRNTFLLAFASLFADISTEMLYPVLPVFLTQTLNASGSVVGLVEGLAQATQNIVQGFSGAPSDKLQKRKSVALVGYFLAAIAKPLMGLSTVWLRASGIGWYNTTVGLLQLVASVAAGLLWDHVGHAAVFYCGAFFATVGMAALVLLIPAHRGSRHGAA